MLVTRASRSLPALHSRRAGATPHREKPRELRDRVEPSRATESSARASESGISSPVTATTSTSAPASSANAVIYYGSWLDDASIVSPGEVWVGLSTGYWRGQGSRQIDAPVASVAVGISRRVQAGGSFSFYHFRDADGFSDTGAGSMSVYGKFVLIDPATTTKAIGVAITPLVEFSPGGEDQVGWALPVNIEARRGNTRVYGSAGYFSRGSTFATVGLDLAVGIVQPSWRRSASRMRAPAPIRPLSAWAAFYSLTCNERSVCGPREHLDARRNGPWRAVVGRRRLLPAYRNPSNRNELDRMGTV